jgi:hypothetical protein
VPVLRHLIDVRLSYLSGTTTFLSPISDVAAKLANTSLDLDADSEHKQNGAGAGGPGYKLSFVFEPNDWFENEVLEKTYVYRKELDWLRNTVVGRSEGTPIRWKSAEKDLTKNVEALGEFMAYRCWFGD